ncbi:MAG: RNA polymerase sigma factor [Bryobacteraceae bacterium]|jgi:RNA polymerase sigma-70 factor (ECF subfamily)
MLPDVLPEDPIEALMAGYQQGDGERTRALIERVSPPLYRFFLAQVRSRRDADDLLQETWMRIHQARHTFRPGQPLLPWVYAIARHIRIDHYRRSLRAEAREVQVETLPDPPAPAGRASGADLSAILGDLPESQREVLVMLKVSGMSLEEVARATSSSVGSVKQKAHRAYRKLRGVLRGDGA